MKDIIEEVEGLWNNHERQREREKLLESLEREGKAEWVDDVLFIQGEQETGILHRQYHVYRLSIDRAVHTFQSN
jgi:hypothetical protein